MYVYVLFMYCIFYSVRGHHGKTVWLNGPPSINMFEIKYRIVLVKTCDKTHDKSWSGPIFIHWVIALVYCIPWVPRSEILWGKKAIYCWYCFINHCGFFIYHLPLCISILEWIRCFLEMAIQWKCSLYRYMHFPIPGLQRLFYCACIW